jgi:L-amino acid N-acyltransferase
MSLGYFYSMAEKNMQISKLNFKIRDAHRNDMNSVREIFNEVLINTTATFEEEPSSLKTWIEIFDLKLSQKMPFIVAEHNSVVIGYGTYGPFRKASGYKITVEHSLHIDRQYRGQGIGKAILNALIQKASESSIENMIAAVDADNLSSIKLHENLGFKIVGKIESVARKFSKDLTLVLLQLRL